MVTLGLASLFCSQTALLNERPAWLECSCREKETVSPLPFQEFSWGPFNKRYISKRERDKQKFIYIKVPKEMVASRRRLSIRAEIPFTVSRAFPVSAVSKKKSAHNAKEAYSGLQHTYKHLQVQPSTCAPGVESKQSLTLPSAGHSCSVPGHLVHIPGFLNPWLCHPSKLHGGLLSLLLPSMENEVNIISSNE